MNTAYPVKTLNQLRPFLVGFRKTRGLTQAELARRLDVTQQTYARMEANPATASFERIFRVFSILGVEIVLSDGSFTLAAVSAEVTDKTHLHPARREKW